MQTEGSQGNEGVAEGALNASPQEIRARIISVIGAAGYPKMQRILGLTGKSHLDGMATIPTEELPTEPGWYHVLTKDLSWIETIKLDEGRIVTRVGTENIFRREYYSGMLFLRVPTPKEIIEDERAFEIEALRERLRKQDQAISYMRRGYQDAVSRATDYKDQLSKFIRLRRERGCDVRGEFREAITLELDPDASRHMETEELIQVVAKQLVDGFRREVGL